jgi:EmrB/QacA subfamily drug resistance transporter
MGRNRNLVLVAMIFAVAMSFIDQTIVTIAAPQIQHDLHLTSTGIQWMVNAYLLALAVFFAFGGRLADIFGHAKICVIGVVIFAVSSAMCGLTPSASIAEPWFIAFRFVQGAGGALLFPAAIAIVVQNFELNERGKALAIFFGIAGALTAVGPIVGGWLVEWTWRSIFWINLPVAAIALVLIAVSKPHSEHRRAPIDVRGLLLIAGGVGLSVLGFQQSAQWGWGSVATWACIVIGLALLLVFGKVELSEREPLIDLRIFAIRPFSVDNAVLGLSMVAFIPLFLFASQYAQISLGEGPSQASTILLYYFLGFAIGTQVGGRRLDASGVRRPVISGCILAAVGFFWWASVTTDLTMNAQTYAIILTGFGMGQIISPANTDAVNRAGRLSYGEATGITQTVRNYFAAIGVAVLGTILIGTMRSKVASYLVANEHLSPAAAAIRAKASSQQSVGAGSSVPHWVRLDFAQSFSQLLTIMAFLMVAAGVLAFLGLPKGRQEEAPEASQAAAPA